MQFVVIASLVASVLAVPAEMIPRNNGGGGSGPVCPSGLYSNPQCCATDVLGLADLDCATPSNSFNNAADFQKVCAAKGQRARCCVIPIAGQALLCQAVPGV